MLGSSATPDQRKAALVTFNAATGHYREHNNSPYTQKLIGRNNISEITFEWGQRDIAAKVDSKKVNHTVRWRMDGKAPDNSTPDVDFPSTYVMWTTYSVSLDPNDKSYPDKKATTEGP